MNQYRPQLIAPSFASRRWMVSAAGILLAGLLTLTAQAQVKPRPGGPLPGPGTAGSPGTPGPRPGGPGMVPGGPRPGGALPFLGELDLTDAQKEQVKSIVERSREESKPIAEELRKLQPKKQALIYTETFDEAAALILVDEELALQKALTLNQMATQHAVYNVLTAEQKAKLAELIAKRKEMGPPKPTPGQGNALPWGGFPRRP
ncbi:MAG: Spy/CpxP family protein refolding chaperone [Blastocatellia bacterium]